MNILIVLIVLIIIIILFSILLNKEFFQSVDEVTNVFHIKKNVFYNIKDTCNITTAVGNKYAIGCVSDLNKFNDLNLDKGNVIINTNDNTNNVFSINNLCLNGICFNETNINSLKNANGIKFSYDSNEDADIENNPNGVTHIPQFLDTKDKPIYYDKNNSDIIPHKLCFNSKDDKICIEKKDIDILLGKRGIKLTAGKDDHIIPYNIEFGWRGMGVSDVMKHLFYKKQNTPCPKEFIDNADYNCFSTDDRHKCDEPTQDDINNKMNNFRIYPSTTKDGVIPDDSSYTHIHS